MTRTLQPGKLTTHEVLQRSGIGSSKTLTRWHQQRLIPPPSIQTHPNGRGKVAYWPAWIIFRIREVRSRLERGEQLEQIASSLGQDWSAEEKRWIRTRYDFAAAYAQLNRDEAILEFAELASNIVYDYLCQIGVRRPGSVYDKLWEMFSNKKFIDDMLELLHQGYTPVVAVIGKKLKVVPDFLLAMATSDPELLNQPVLILPFREAFIEAFAKAEPELSKARRYVAVQRVVDRESKSAREHTYEYQSPWGFKLKQ